MEHKIYLHDYDIPTPSGGDEGDLCKGATIDQFELSTPMSNTSGANAIKS